MGHFLEQYVSLEPKCPTERYEDDYDDANDGDNYDNDDDIDAAGTRGQGPGGEDQGLSRGR